MATYTFIAADLRTNSILNEYPLEQVTFETRLNSVGNLSAKLRLGDSRVMALDPIGTLQETRTAIYVDRDGQLVWGGPLVTTSYDSDSKLLDLGCNTFEWYLKRRKIAENRSYTNQDQLAVVQDLINYLKSKTGGDIGITVGTETSGSLVTLSFAGSEKRLVYQEIANLSATTTGFDWSIDVAYDSNGVMQRYLRLGYPRRGRAANATGLMFEAPGNIMGYTWPRDGSAVANTYFGIGAGKGDTMLQSQAAAPSQIDAGYPLLEDDVTDKTIYAQGVLDAYTAGSLIAHQAPVQAVTVRVRADADPVLGSYTQGDEARFRITDECFPTTVDTFQRIIGIKVAVPSQGVPEQVTLTLGPTL